MTADIVVIVSLALVVVALFVLLRMNRKRGALKIPEGVTVYQDQGIHKPETTLVSHQYGLKGRPDLLIQQGDLIIPVEAKMGRTPREPYFGHIMQLMAYCLLVEEIYGIRPPHGVLRYPERQFEIAYTNAREAQLKNILIEMREKKQSGELRRNHTIVGRCSACGFRQQCDERLDTQMQ